MCDIKSMTITLQARQAQKPITSAGKDLIDGACNMIIAAKHLAVKPRDPPTYQQYSNHSHCVSDAIKKTRFSRFTICINIIISIIPMENEYL